ncbi:MAG: DUF6368 family protein [Rhodothermales bacterium]
MGLRSRILLRRPLNDIERNAIGYGLRKFCSRVESGYFEEEGWDFWIENGKAIRVNFRGPMRRMYISFYSNEIRIDPLEAAKIAEHFGWTPHYAFNIGTYAHQPEDHLLLGGLILNLAAQFDGLIDYCGYLTPGRMSDSQKELRERLKTLKGKVCVINGQYQHHVSDTKFLLSWLQHPNFMMI